MRFLIALTTTLALFAINCDQALAAEVSETESDSGEPAAAPTEEKRVLTPEELAEKESRKACKQKICDIIATRDPDGEDVACDIVKTWREEDIVKMLGGRISWPWGKAVCQSKLEVNRRPLALAMTQDRYEMTLPAQKVQCTLSQKSEGAPYVVEIVLTPRAKFENGKAVEAKANWGDASAPMLVYPLVYAGTALDNSANVLGGEIVRMINEFTTKKCAELKVEAPAPTAAP